MTEHVPTPGRKAAGAMARRLAEALKRDHGLALKHTQTVDLIAASLGFRNRHELAEAQAQADKAEAAQTPLRQADDAGLNPQQKLAAALYCGGEFAHAETPEDAAEVGDTLFHHLVAELADLETESEAMRAIGEDAARLEALLETMQAQGPVDPGDLRRADLDAFQIFVGEAWLEGRYRHLASRADLDATGDLLLRFCLIEVSQDEGCEDWGEAMRRLETARDDLRELERAFRMRAEGGAVPKPIPRPTPPENLIESKEELARLLIRVTDNDGDTVDRYALFFTDGDCLTLSPTPSHPQGVSIWGDYDPVTIDQIVAEGRARDILLTDLPENVLKHAIDRVNDGYQDYLAAKARKGMTREEVLDQLDERRHDLCGMELQRDVL